MSHEYHEAFSQGQFSWSQDLARFAFETYSLLAPGPGVSTELAELAIVVREQKQREKGLQVQTMITSTQSPEKYYNKKIQLPLTLKSCKWHEHK